ncbi:MAG TPA: hypothetical protein VKD72_22915 [Gemmataceae bacterium]|nr:hypothetical protein [Gemmataceae bacterium]
MFTCSTASGVHECVFGVLALESEPVDPACEDERTSRLAGKQAARCFTGAAGHLRCWRAV